MTTKKINVVLKLDKNDYEILEELSYVKRLPISTMCRSFVVETKEFKDMSKEFEELESKRIHQEMEFKDLSEKKVK